MAAIPKMGIFRRLTGKMTGTLLPTSNEKSHTVGRAKTLSRTDTASATRNSTSDQKGNHLNRYPAYYMTPQLLKTYLDEKFGKYDFQITMSTGYFEFNTPRLLTQEELSELGKRAEEWNRQKWDEEA